MQESDCLKKILLFYKKSSYKIYCLERKNPFYLRDTLIARRQVKRFKEAHEEHCATLAYLEGLLRQYGLSYDKMVRGRSLPEKTYAVVITVGGDGTFLEATHKFEGQTIIGVNSSPRYSVGKLCVLRRENLERFVRRLAEGRLLIRPLHRLELRWKDGRPATLVTNDVLVSHKNPAAMSRYELRIGKTLERQHSSGVWIATAAGSSGAIYSAGGKHINRWRKDFQYKPRELHVGILERYVLTGGILAESQSIHLTSLMREGTVFVDGAHIRERFSFGDQVRIALSKRPVQTVDCS